MILPALLEKRFVNIDTAVDSLFLLKGSDVHENKVKLFLRRGEVENAMPICEKPRRTLRRYRLVSPRMSAPVFEQAMWIGLV